MNREKLIRIFDKQANGYEKRRKNQSQAKWREKLLSSAKGKVLEVAVGAGANFQFYPQGVEVTAVDFSGEMLKKAKSAAIEEGVNAQFIHSDVEFLSFEDHSFDTIISTLSLCGYENPTKILSLINKWCKPDGQILLLEHGKSSNPLIGYLQKMLNPLNRKVIGCEIDRDILRIIESSNIQIDQIEHYLKNMVHIVWAKPK